MESKVIWIINQYAGSRLHGMEFRHYYLAKALLKLGHKPFIISGSYSHLFKAQPSVMGDYTFEKIDGIDYCWVKVPPYERSVSAGRVMNMLRFMLALRSFPVNDLEDPDAIIVSSPSLFPVKRAHKWSKRFGAKLFFEVRDIWPLTLRELGNLSSFHPLIMLMQHFENYAYRNADKVVSLLPNAEEHMQKHGMKPGKFAVIPNGIDLEEVSRTEPLDEAIGSKIPSDIFTVGYAGTFGIANAIDVLVEAARLLRNEPVQFLLVGTGDQEQRLRKLAEGLPNIIFTGAVKKTQMQSMLAHFDACYIGLKSEPLFRFGVSPNKLFDYMYAAKPIVYSIDSGNRPVDDAQCGISVKSEDPQAVAAAIMRLYSLPAEERRRMGDNGRTYVLKHHTFEMIALKFLELLK
jgi:glycosyltransferase involved in cell wall biosynthesis